jgi:hypothetical protein
MKKLLIQNLKWSSLVFITSLLVIVLTLFINKEASVVFRIELVGATLTHLILAFRLNYTLMNLKGRDFPIFLCALGSLVMTCMFLYVLVVFVVNIGMLFGLVQC